jgi:hypothetical protein
VQFVLRGYYRGFNNSAVSDYRRGCFITTGLDTQDVNGFALHKVDVSERKVKSKVLAVKSRSYKEIES